MKIIDIQAETTPLIADSGSATDALSNWKTIQGVIDREGPLGGCLIKLPAGSFTFQHPIVVDRYNVQIAGAGDGITTLRAGVYMNQPVILVGWPRNYTGPVNVGATLTPADFIPLAGKLDSSVTSGRGFALRKGLHLNIPWQAWSHPSPTTAWAGVKAFTLEMALDFGPNGLGGAKDDQWGVICGISDGPMDFAPLGIMWNSGGLYCAFQTADRVHHQFAIRDPLPTRLKGIHRVSFQVDASAGTFGATLDGQWVTNLVDQVKPSFKAGNSTFRSSITAPFKFAGDGPSDGTQTSYGVSPGFAFGLLGARLSDTARYSASALPGNDRSRFFTNDAHTIALLPMDDDQDYAISSRIVRSTGGQNYGGWVGAAYLTDGNAAGNGYASTAGCTISDMTIAGNYRGLVLGMGSAQGFRGRNLTISGGIPLGNHRMGSNYTTTLEGRINLSGVQCGLLLDYAAMNIEGNLTITKLGFAGIYSTNTTLWFDTIFMLTAGTVDTKWFVYADNMLKGRSIIVDNEWWATPNLEAIVRFDLFAYVPLNNLEIDMVQPSEMGPGASIVKLTGGSVPDAPTYATRASVRLPNVVCWSSAAFKGALEVADRRFYGAIDTAWEPTNPEVPFLVVSSSDAKCNMQVLHRSLAALPTAGKWTANCDRIVNPNPAAGQLTEAVCVQSGTGSAAKWQTFTPTIPA